MPIWPSEEHMLEIQQHNNNSATEHLMICFDIQYFGQFVEKIEEILNTEDNVVPNTPRPVR